MTRKTIKTNALDDKRLEIIKASLSHVAFDGWTSTALVRGGAELGLTSEQVRLLFPQGEIQMMSLFAHWLNLEMLRRVHPSTLEKLRLREKITMCLKTRIEILTPHREAVRRLMSTLLLPKYGFLKHRLTYQAVDSMWRTAGDGSTDFNFYTKRGVLAGVYLSTLLYWVMDESENFEDTMAFIERRIDDVMQIPSIKVKLKEMTGRIPNPIYFFNPPTSVN